MRSVEWAAGLLEGEGSFIRKGAHSVVVQCQMTDLDVLEGLQQLFGGSMYGPIAPAKEHWKQTYVWKVHGSVAVECMKAILPHMGVRRSERIKEMIALVEDRKATVADRTDRYEQALQAYLRGEGSVRNIAAQYDVVWGVLARKAREYKAS